MRRGPLALIIVIISLVGVVATAYTAYTLNTNPPNNCGSGSNFSRPYLYGSIGNSQYYAIDANFTDSGQSVSLSTVSFKTVDFNDPYLQHLESIQCVNGPSTGSAHATVQVTFRDGTIETLQSISYKDAQPSNTILTTHQGPQAGIRWDSARSRLILLVSTS